MEDARAHHHLSDVLVLQEAEFAGEMNAAHAKLAVGETEFSLTSPFTLVILNYVLTLSDNRLRNRPVA